MLINETMNHYYCDSEPLNQKRKPENEDVLFQCRKQFTNSPIVEIEWRKSQACRS
jgi:hypothetical protein